MEFIRAFTQALRTHTAKQNRKAGTRAYYNSGKVYLSRLFGYKKVGDRYEPDERYAPAIRTIFSMLAAGKTLVEVKQALDSMKARDSSNNRYSLARITALVRPIYAGRIKQRGRTIQVNNLSPIVSFAIFRKAENQIKIEKKKLV